MAAKEYMREATYAEALCARLADLTEQSDAIEWKPGPEATSAAGDMKSRTSYRGHLRRVAARSAAAGMFFSIVQWERDDDFPGYAFTASDAEGALVNFGGSRGSQAQRLHIAVEARLHHPGVSERRQAMLDTLDSL